MLNARRTALIVAASAAAFMTAGTTAAAATIDGVYADDLGGDWHTADTRPDGTLAWADTYGGELGTGAAVLSTPSGAAKVQLFTEAHDGTYLRDITELSYSTYQAVAPAGSPVLPALNIRADVDNDGDVDGYLVFEPYQNFGNAAIHAGTWQSWDAWQDKKAQWWSGQIVTAPDATTLLCPQDKPCTIEALLAAYPDTVIREDSVSLRSPSTPVDADFNGSIGFNQGSGNAEVTGAADALHIATNPEGDSVVVDVTYDFEAGAEPEPEIVLSGKEDCKSGGWKTSTAPVFRNQGDCVSHFASSGRSQK